MRISDWSSDVCSSDLKCDALRVEYLDMVEQLLRQRFVDPRRRLIEQYQARLHHQHPPQGQQFALSAGQVPGHFVGEVIQAQERQDLDRKSVVEGKRVEVRFELGGWRIIKKKKK